LPKRTVLGPNLLYAIFLAPKYGEFVLRNNGGNGEKWPKKHRPVKTAKSECMTLAAFLVIFFVKYVKNDVLGVQIRIHTF